MFAPKQFIVGGQSSHKIYVNRPKGINQKQIFNDLDKIRSNRNRIAHHEPLCFNSNNQINIEKTTDTYQILI
jgi:hypothetical protein